MYMKEQIVTVATGASGATAVEAVSMLELSDVSSTGGIVQVAIQIIIGIVTLLGLLKPKNKIKIKNQ